MVLRGNSVKFLHVRDNVEPTVSLCYHVVLNALNRPSTTPTLNALMVAMDDEMQVYRNGLHIDGETFLARYCEAVCFGHVL